MNNFYRNTAAVLVLTLFTGLAVFTAVQLGGRLFGTSTASAQTVTTQSATSTSGSSSGTASGSTSGSSSTEQGSDAYGQSSGSDSGSSSGQTYTCPATGCTASSCHATQ
jgi:hypothetical protein